MRKAHKLPSREDYLQVIKIVARESAPLFKKNGWEWATTNWEAPLRIPGEELITHTLTYLVNYILTEDWGRRKPILATGGFEITPEGIRLKRKTDKGDKIDVFWPVPGTPKREPKPPEVMLGGLPKRKIYLLNLREISDSSSSRIR